MPFAARYANSRDSQASQAQAQTFSRTTKKQTTLAPEEEFGFPAEAESYEEDPFGFGFSLDDSQSNSVPTHSSATVPFPILQETSAPFNQPEPLSLPAPVRAVSALHERASSSHSLTAPVRAAVRASSSQSEPTSLPAPVRAVSALVTSSSQSVPAPVRADSQSKPNLLQQLLEAARSPAE